MSSNLDNPKRSRWRERSASTMHFVTPTQRQEQQDLVDNIRDPEVRKQARRVGAHKVQIKR